MTLIVTPTKRLDRVKLAAYRRTERRWRKVAQGGQYAYRVRAVDLYVEALHTEQRLTDRAVRLMTEPELDALHEATHADLADLAARDGIPLALDSYWNRGA